jgi:hypothetical protein
MNLLAALLIADSVRTRIEQGDCPTEPPQTRETLEDVVCELQRALARDAVAVEFVALKNSRDMLRKALESIAANTCCGPCQEAAAVARASLCEAVS